MGVYTCKQPNGLYCNFSTVVDDILEYNMTEEEFIKEYQIKWGMNSFTRQAALDVLKNHLKPFDRIKQDYYPNNCSTPEEFFESLKEMGDPVNEETKKMIYDRANRNE